MHLKNKAVALILFLLAVCLMAAGCGNNPANSGTAIDDAIDHGKFYTGVSVVGVDLSDLTYDEAYPLVETALNRYVEEIEVNIRYDDNSWLLGKSEFGARADVDGTLRVAMAYGRDGTTQENNEARELAKTQGVAIMPEIGVDRTDALSAAAIATQEVPTTAQDAYCTFDEEKTGNDRLVFHPSTDGVSPNYEKMADDIMAALKTAQFPVTIELEVEMTPATITEDQLRQNITLVSSFTTQYTQANSSNRTQNLALGMQKLNGAVVEPGAAFSFNDYIGPRTPDLGWLKAPVIVGGVSFEDDYGGGICQVSTTLYNAVARADMQIDQRKHHSIPSTYVDHGLDATVSYGTTDFVFTNTSDYPLYIFAHIDKDAKKVTVEVYGRALENGEKIELVSKEIETYEPAETVVQLDPTLAPDETVETITARKGYKVEVYKNTYDKDGNLLNSEKLYTDTYKAVQGVTSVGINVYNSMFPSTAGPLTAG